jgi:hypothetical protein
MFEAMKNQPGRRIRASSECFPYVINVVPDVMYVMFSSARIFNSLVTGDLNWGDLLFGQIRRIVEARLNVFSGKRRVLGDQILDRVSNSPTCGRFDEPGF